MEPKKSMNFFEKKTLHQQNKQYDLNFLNDFDRFFIHNIDRFFNFILKNDFPQKNKKPSKKNDSGFSKKQESS